MESKKVYMTFSYSIVGLKEDLRELQTLINQIADKLEDIDGKSYKLEMCLSTPAKKSDADN